MRDSHRAGFKPHFLHPKFWPTWVIILGGSVLAFIQRGTKGQVNFKWPFI